MKTIFVIQDVISKEYYWQYRIDEGFNFDLNDTKKFNTKNDALKELEEEYLQELFEERFLEIKEYINYG